MTVKELKRLLDGCPDNAKVILSSDSEGNSFGTLEEDSLSRVAADGSPAISAQNTAGIVLFPFKERAEITEVLKE